MTSRGSKYDPLRDHLLASGSSTVQLSFAEIERIIGHELPATAYNNERWWANEEVRATRHVQCRAWQTAGYCAAPNLAAKTVTFFRIPKQN